MPGVVLLVYPGIYQNLLTWKSKPALPVVYLFDVGIIGLRGVSTPVLIMQKLVRKTGLMDNYRVS